MDAALHHLHVALRQARRSVLPVPVRLACTFAVVDLCVSLDYVREILFVYRLNIPQDHTWTTFRSSRSSSSKPSECEG